MYSSLGRPSIAPEKLLRGALIQAFYTVRSERLLMEQLDYNLLFRWFVGLGVDDPVWDHSTYSKNCDRAACKCSSPPARSPLTTDNYASHLK
jgi:transposase